MNRRTLVTVVLLLTGGVSAVAAQGRAGRYAGRPLADVLSELGRQGTPLVFSSRLVLPEMRVVAEPSAGSTRVVLDQILAPHGLRIETGPKGQWLVVAVPPLPQASDVSAVPPAVDGSVLVTLRHEGTDALLRAAAVVLRSDTGAADVRADGRIVISGLAAGPHFLEVAVPGYPPPGPTMAVVRSDGPTEARFDLPSVPDRPDGPIGVVPAVEIVATNGIDHRETVNVAVPREPSLGGASTMAMPAEELMKGAGHGNNLLAPLQALPGVRNGREFDGRLIVRGGAPDENLVLLDGVEVLSPYHAFGLASAFLPTAVESVDLSVGGFDARYGDRLSSVLSVRSRDGPRDRRWQGMGGVGIFDADLMAGGSLPGLANASWMAAGRYSYADLIVGSVLQFGVPRYGDLHARLAWEPRPGLRVSWLGLAGHERSNYREHDDPGENWTLGTRVPSALTSFGIEGTNGSRHAWRVFASVYDVRDEMDMHGLLSTDARGTVDDSGPAGHLASVSFGRHAAVGDWTLHGAWTIAGSARQAWDVGAELHWLHTRWQWEVAGDRNPDLANRIVPWPYGLPGASLPDSLDSRLDYRRAAAWIQHHAEIGARMSLQTGIRVDRNDLARGAAVSPRASIVVRLDGATRLTAGAGVYRQSPGYEKLLLSDYFIDLGAGGPLRSARAVHAALGVERDLLPGISARVEAYRKSYADLIVGRLETEDERLARLARYDFGEFTAHLPTEPEITSLPANAASGVAYGVDALLTRSAAARDPRVTGWLSYSYAVARRSAYGYTVPFDYDRRHTLSGIAEFRLHPFVTVSGMIRLASGSPWTAPSGVRIAAREDTADSDGDGNVTELIPARDAQGYLVYTHDLGGLARTNSSRLPLYARLDARVTYQPGGAEGRWSLYVDVINLLNRENPGLVTCRVGGASNGGVPGFVREPDFSVPFLPSVGVRFRF